MLTDIVQRLHLEFLVMDLDLETFLTTLYVMTDDWYQRVILPKLRSG